MARKAAQRKDVSDADQVLLVRDRLLKQFGAGAVARLADPGAYEDVQFVIPTGLTPLDTAIGVGGLPGGKLIEMFGRESSGKTTLVKSLIAHAQSAFKVKTLFLDFEQSGDSVDDTNLGLDPELTLVSQPDTLQVGFSLIDATIREYDALGQPLLAVLDSVAAAPLAEELDREYTEMLTNRPGQRAAFLGRGLPKLVQTMKGTRSVVILVNQVRQTIGGGPYAPQWFSPGGMALKHFAHVRLETRRLGAIKAKDEQIGFEFVVKVVKNKVAPPWRDAKLALYYDPRRVEGGG